jgi:hypothetical protein
MPPQAPVTVPLNISAVTTFTSTSVPTTIAIVQGPIVIPDAYSGSFPIATTAGNCVVVAISTFNTTSGDIPAVSGVTLGGSGDHFEAGATAVVNVFTNGVYTLASVWVDFNCLGGQTAIVVSGSNLSPNANTGITLWEISGLSTSNPVDQISTNNSTTSGNWTSGATPATTVANEIWIGAVTAGAGANPLPSGWTNSQYNTNGEGASGYRIVTSTGAATYGPGSTNAQWSACVVTLKSGVVLAGGGTAQIGPRNQRELWYPQVISVSASTAVNQATCKTYVGSDTSQPNFVWQTLNGSTGDTTANIAGPGLAALNLPGRVVHCGEYIWAIWTNGDGNAQGRLNIQGIKVMNSGGPPGWVHARTRP